MAIAIARRSATCAGAKPPISGSRMLNCSRYMPWSGARSARIPASRSGAFSVVPSKTSAAWA